MSAASERRVRLVWVLGLGGLGLLAGACSKGSETAAPMHSTDLAQGEAQRSKFADPLAELDALEARMSQLGLPVAEPSLGSASSTRDRGERKQAGADEAAGADMVEAEGQAEQAPAEDSEAPAFAAESQPSQPMAADQGEACMSVCDLNEMICTLEEQICGLAREHEGERIYADACRRASEDCDVAGDACDRCAG